MIKINCLLAAFLISIFSVNAQKNWTLKECIEYAVENNIDIKKQIIAKENQEIQLNTAKMSRLPNLNAGVGQNFGFGRSADRDGVTKDNSSSSSSFNLSTGVPIFTGFRIPNEIKYQKFELAAAIEDLNKAKEDLSLNITSYFLQTMLYKELLVIAQEQVKLSKEQVKQTEALVNAGKSALSELADMQSQLAKDELSLTESSNNVKISLLTLSQLLNLDSESGFDIEMPDLNQLYLSNINDLESPMAVFEKSVENRSSIKSAQFKLNGSQHSLKIARAGYYPTLNMNAGYSNNYFYNYNLEEGYKNSSFSNQIKNNGSEYIGLSLSIPLFNRFSTRNQVRQTQLNIENMKLSLLNAKQNLYKEIQQAYTSAVASGDKYKSAQKAVAAAKIAFGYESEKFANGRSTPFDLDNVQTRYNRALSEEAQAKYDYVFRVKILDFYNGKPLFNE
ncbi:MAG: TolC family protein [Bacteroidales bacterium]|nr:TolC family protein [Bacteroidales bacterium]